MQLFSYQFMPNHWHPVLRPTRDGEMSRFQRWITATHTMRYHAHYHTSGEGHVYQGRCKSFPIQDDSHFLTVCRYVERNTLRAALVPRTELWRWGSLWRWLQPTEPEPALLSAWPIPRLPNWVSKVNEALSEAELQALRKSAQRGSPFGDLSWTTETSQRLGLMTTGRLQVRFLNESEKKES